MVRLFYKFSKSQQATALFGAPGVQILRSNGLAVRGKSASKQTWKNFFVRTKVGQNLINLIKFNFCDNCVFMIYRSFARRWSFGYLWDFFFVFFRNSLILSKYMLCEHNLFYIWTLQKDCMERCEICCHKVKSIWKNYLSIFGFFILI